jgi:hypothetical protein
LLIFSYRSPFKNFGQQKRRLGALGTTCGINQLASKREKQPTGPWGRTGSNGSGKEAETNMIKYFLTMSYCSTRFFKRATCF